MWEEWMDDDMFKQAESKLEEQTELEQKIDRIAHPLKHKIINAKDNFAIFLLLNF